MIKSLIKYTGGKFQEYNKFKNFIPEKFDNYYEPFVGGGGVLLRLHNDGKLRNGIYINDFSQTLIDFYNNITNPELKKELEKISNAWDYVREIGKKTAEEFKGCFLKSIEEHQEFHDNNLEDFLSKKYKDLKFDFHGFNVINKTICGLSDKSKRFIKKHQDKINGTDKDKRPLELNDQLAYECITTSVCQSFYFVIRDMYNHWNNNGGRENYRTCEMIAQWLFIREYCFGSMFRFDNNGNFNIPYGGKSYNNKCFSCKIENLVSNETINLFKKVSTLSKDFEDAINTWKPQKDDFVFLDPPYDSTFSEYDGNSFTKKDHERLRDCLTKLESKWLLVIANNDFISNLYKDFNIQKYNKKYAYQARGEYDTKNTTHLAITNYKIEKKF